jgi:hypothetical protein
MAVTIDGTTGVSAVQDGVVTESDLTAATRSTLVSGRRNMIINGAMQVWQRGTSFAAGAGIVYTADRFWRYSGTSGNIERSTDAPTGFAYSWYGNTTGVFSGGTTVEIDNNGGRSGYFPQQKYVYSFYLKGDFSNTYLAVGFRNATGTGTDEVPIITFSAGNGNGFGNYSDWTRVEKVIDTTGFTPHPNNKSLDLEFGSFPVGGKATGFQFEIGETPTAFEHRSYSEELLLCQRYFQKSSDGVPTQNSFGGHQIHVASGQDPQSVIPLSPNMRVIPAITLYSAHGSGTSGQWYGAAFGSSFSSNARGFGASRRSFIIDNTDVNAPSSGWCEIGWTVDAEI